MIKNDLDKRAEEFAKTKSRCARCKFCEDYADDMKCDKFNKYVRLYREIATTQKAIDDAQWRKDMEYVNVKKQELIDKICNYILTHSTYAVQPTTYIENMKKELELGDTISPAPIQGTGNCMDAHGKFRIVNSPNTPPDRFRY